MDCPLTSSVLESLQAVLPPSLALTLLSDVAHTSQVLTENSHRLTSDQRASLADARDWSSFLVVLDNLLYRILGSTSTQAGPSPSHLQPNQPPSDDDWFSLLATGYHHSYANDNMKVLTGLKPTCILPHCSPPLSVQPVLLQEMASKPEEFAQCLPTIFSALHLVFQDLQLNFLQ